MMEVMASIASAGGERAGGGHGIPFQRRNVQEWSRLDELTGMLEHARVETDHWAASTSNTSHHFGKVVDSRSRNLADGALEQRQQTKQLEVFQASIPGGSLQVIRSQSVTSTSSSWHGQSKINTNSHWSSSGNNFLALPSSQNNKEFDNLKLPLNPLDLSSQKNKASVGRSGSIGSRRPPTRPRSIVGLRSDDVVISEEKDDSQISQLSHICHKFHQEAKDAILTNSEAPLLRKHRPLANGHSIYELDANDNIGITNDNNTFRLTQLLEESSQSSASEILKSSSESTITNSHQSLASKKSCSIEDLHLSEGGEKMTENGDNNTDWRRSSKVRRSLQFTPKQNSTEKDNDVVSSSVSVSKIKQEIEARKQLVSSALKSNQWNNLGQLEGVLGVLRNSVNSADTDNSKSENKDGKEQTNSIAPANSPTKKRHTFITVESLKEVRGRLRKLNSPIDDDYSPKIEEVDDGIVTEPKSESPPPEVKPEKLSKSSVKSFVYGMEAAIKSTKQPITGTGSLESRSSNKSNGSTNRSEEWYNRRKSYGFEQVGNQHINQTMSTDKNKVDSSTDSGICRSSETVTYPWTKTINSDRSFESGKRKTSQNIIIKQAQDESETNHNKITFEKDNETYVAQKGRKTVVTLGSSYSNNSSWNWNSNSNNNSNANNNNNTINNEEGHKEIVRKGKIADALRSLREKSSLFESHRLSEPITISIPIQPVSRAESTDPKTLLLKQTKEPDEDLKKDYLTQNTQITPYSDLIYGKDSKPKDEFKDDMKKIEKDGSNANTKVILWNNENSSTGSNWNGKTEMKRHSIAVDEAKYMNTSKVNGSYYIQENAKPIEISKTFSQNGKYVNDISMQSQNSSTAYTVSYPSDRDSNRLNSENDLDSSANEKKHKKVEFCKTEVHFAAESGRFNIVETDGKPPPSHNFRRRRRSNSETSHNTAGLPEIRFGDSQYEKNLLTGNDKDSGTDVNMKTLNYRGSPVFVDAEKDDQVIFAETNATIPSSNSKDDVIIDEEAARSNEPHILVDDDTPKPRSILKNSIPKPRPFFLGEEIPINPKQDPEETKPWGIKLKTAETNQIQTNTAVTMNISSEPKETEFQRLLRSLRPTSHRNTEYPSSLPHVESSSTAEDNGLEVRITSSVPDQRRASWSVADRVRHVEELRTKGYSTKVNFGASETTVIDNKQPQQMRVIAPRQETTEQPLTNHSLVNNEDVSVRGAVAPTKQSQSSQHRVVATTVLQAYEPQQSRIQGVETLVSTHSGNPKITSISLRYNDDAPLQKQATITAVHPKPVYSDSTVEHKNYHHISNSAYNVQTSIKQYDSGERIWTFSKSDSRSKRDISPEYKKQQAEHEKKIMAIQTKIANENDVSHGLKSAKLVLRKSVSPSKESLLNIQSNDNDTVLHSDSNYRNNESSLSPKYLSTSPSLKSPKYNEIKHEKSLNKDPDYVNVQVDIKPSHSKTDHYESITNTQAVNKVKRDKVVRQEHIKTQDIRKSQNDRSTERKLSTSSSGRDSWLNTPREPQPRQRNDVQSKRYSHETKRDKKVLSETKTKSNVMKSVKKRSESPIYQNGDVYSDRKESNDKMETDSAILEELTKAADQILLAVNGYTDEESFRGSSDDEYNRRHSKEKIISKPLCTISEMPTKKPTTNNVKSSARISHTTVAKSTRSSEIRRDYISSKNKLGKTSSNSSMDSGPVEPRTSLSAEDRSKRRAARLLQRASSRELLLQTAASSSEDIGSGSEAGTLRTKPRVMRRTRTQGTRSSTSTQYTATHLHRNNAVTSESRTKERSQRALSNSESAVSKSHSVTHPPRKVRALSEEKSIKQRSVAGSAPTVRCERAERRSLAPASNSARTSNVLNKKKSNTSQSDESVKARK